MFTDCAVSVLLNPPRTPTLTLHSCTLRGPVLSRAMGLLASYLLHGSVASRQPELRGVITVKD